MTQDKAKIALVMGLNKGMGKNTALALARKGVDVIVTYRSSDVLQHSSPVPTSSSQTPGECP